MKLDRVTRLSGSILVIFLVTIILGEISLRTLHHFRPMFVFYDDSYSRFRGAPGAQAMDIRLNSLGFRDAEFGPKQSNVYRIVAIGDSFAYGVVPYRNNFLTVLESNLNGIGAAEVLNMGIPGTGPKDYFDLFVREGLSLEPDAVLVTFFIGNDITAGAGQVRGGAISRYSYLWSALRYLVWIRPFVEPVPIIPGGDLASYQYCDDCPRWPLGEFLAIETNYAEVFFTNVQETKSNIIYSLQPLLDMKAICDRKQIDFFVVLAPDQVQVSEELASVIMKRGYQPYEKYWDPKYPNRAILEILRSNGVRVLDLLPSFQQVGRAKRLYLPRNTHWNIAGNKLAADQISSWLVNKISLKPTI